MQLLSTEEKSTMLMNLFAYQNDEEIILDTPMLKMCWASMKFLLDKDSEMYKQKSENMKTIGKRNRQVSNDIVTTNNDIVTTNNDIVQSRLDNDNDNVNDNVNVNGNGNGNGDEKDNVDGNKINGTLDTIGETVDYFLTKLTNGISVGKLNQQYPESSSLKEAIAEYRK